MSDCLNDEELLIEENRMLEDANAELIERVKKLEEENRRLKWTLESLDKLEQFLEHKGLVVEYKEWKKEQGE